jgi:superfamily II DNA or RNA helicase
MAYSLTEAIKQIRPGLRKPQADALALFGDMLITAEIPVAGKGDSFAIAVSETRGWPLSPSCLAEFDFALATGVGKTKLAISAARSLSLSNESQTFIFLSHRNLLRRRWIEELHQNQDRNFGGTGSPLLITNGWKGDPTSLDSGRPVFFVQTLQTVLNLDGEWNKLANGEHLVDRLAEREDIVIFVDESHHIDHTTGDEQGWPSAINSLKPRLLIGLTATPNSSRPVLFEYSLNQMLREGVYSKAVRFVRRKSKLGGTVDKKIAIDEALKALSEIKEALSSLPEAKPLREINWMPKVLFACNTLSEVREIEEMLMDDFKVDRRKILTVRSDRPNDELVGKLNGIDHDQEIEYIVAAYMLDEGWDVTSVSVICPLRSLASPANARQLLGRGLRLPLGRRMNCEIFDTLTVVSVGQESLAKIKNEVDSEYSAVVNVVDSLDKRSPLAELVDSSSSGIFEVEVKRKIVPKYPLSYIHPCSVALIDNEMPKFWDVESEEMAGVLNVDREITAQPAAKNSQRNFTLLELLNSISWLDRPNSDVLAGRIDSLGFPKTGVTDSTKRKMTDWINENALLFWTPPLSELEFQFKAVVSSSTPANKSQTLGKGWKSRGWYWGGKKSIYDVCLLDSKPEYEFLSVIDDLENVLCWLRNDPKFVKIHTTSGFYSPDFLVYCKNKVLIVEIKGQHLIEEFKTNKGRQRTVDQWCESQKSTAGVPVEFHLIRSDEIEKRTLEIISRA